MHEKQPVLLLSYDHGGYIFWGKRFKERLEQAFLWLAKYPSFKIGLDNETFAYDTYAEEASEIIGLISEGLKRYKGRFGVGSCTYGQPLSAFINEESNVRQLTYAIKANIKHFGVTPSVYAVSEHAFHSQIPQLIAGVGYKGAIMRTHFMMYGYNPVYNAACGKWVGSDGTAVTTIPTYEGQGANFAVTTFDNWVLTRWPDMTDVSLSDFCERFKGIEPLLASRYDDITLRCESLIEHTQDNAKYQWVLLEDLLERYPEPEEIFRPAPGDFKFRMPWGYCGNRIWNGCREAERYVSLAERANALSVLLGGADQSGRLETAWKRLLISQHHDIQICGLINEADKYLSQSIEISKNVLSSAMNRLTETVNGGECPGIVVFNPLSWSCKQPVSCEIELPKNSGYNGFTLTCGCEKLPCSFDVYDYDKHGIRRAKIQFIADVPALAVKRYDILKAASACSEFSYDSGTLRGPLYEARFDKNGISRIADAKTGKPFVCSEHGRLFSGVINGTSETSIGAWTVSFKSCMAEAVYLGTIGSIGITFSMKFYSGNPRIDCMVTFRHKGERIGSLYHGDAGESESFYALPSPEDNFNGFIHEDKLCFNLCLPYDESVSKAHDMPFIITETEDDIIQGNYWISVNANETGVAVLNKGAMCAVYKDNELKVPLAYANDYIWGSRLLYGDYSHELSILPFFGTPEEAEIHHEATAYQYPFVTQFINGGSPDKNKSQSTCQPVRIAGSPNTVMSALYVENEKILMRIYEYIGKNAQVTINSPLYETNLLGEETSAIMSGHIMLKPNEIKTFSMIL